MALFLRASHTPQNWIGLGLISIYRISRTLPVNLDWTSSTPKLVASAMALGTYMQQVTLANLLTLS